MATDAEVKIEIQSSSSSLFSILSDFIPNAFDFAFGVGSTLWIFYIIKIPWGLYFKARKTRVNGLESMDYDDIQQDQPTLAKLETIEKRLLVTSLSFHVLSALGVWGVAYLTGGKWIRPHASLFFLGSALLRPAWETHFHVRDRIEVLTKRIHYPKVYVDKLIKEVDTLETGSKLREENLKLVQQQHNEKSDKFLSEQREEFEQINNLETKNTKQLQDRYTSLDQKHNQVHNSTLQESVKRLDGVRDNVDLLERQLKDNNQKYQSFYVKQGTQFKEALLSVSADRKMIEGFTSFLKMLREHLFMDKVPIVN